MSSCADIACLLTRCAGSRVADLGGHGARPPTRCAGCSSGHHPPGAQEKDRAEMQEGVGQGRASHLKDGCQGHAAWTIHFRVHRRAQGRVPSQAGADAAEGSVGARVAPGTRWAGILRPVRGRAAVRRTRTHPAQATEQEWAQGGRGAEAAQIAKIASQPVAKWFGDWSYGHGSTAGDVGWWVGQATAAGALPLLVAYDIPWRDCGQYSSGAPRVRPPMSSSSPKWQRGSALGARR